MSPDDNPQKSDGKRAGYNSVIGRALDRVQAAIYLLAAIFLVLLALMAFFIVARDMSQFVNRPLDILLIDTALEDILVIFVITGLIQTLIVYIKSHTIDPRLVLSVGLTAVIRRVLVFGARPKPWEEIALTAVLLFVIILGMYLIGLEMKGEEKLD